MAKNRKNTLSDLNDFLRNTPADVEKPDNYLQAKPHSFVEVDKIAKDDAPISGDLSEMAIVQEIKKLAEKNGKDMRFALLRVIQTAINERESMNSSDLMLLNTAIYLEHTEKMGEGFREMLKRGKD